MGSPRGSSLAGLSRPSNKDRKKNPSRKIPKRKKKLKGAPERSRKVEFLGLQLGKAPEKRRAAQPKVPPSSFPGRLGAVDWPCTFLPLTCGLADAPTHAHTRPSSCPKHHPPLTTGPSTPATFPCLLSASLSPSTVNQVFRSVPLSGLIDDFQGTAKVRLDASLAGTYCPVWCCRCLCLTCCLSSTSTARARR